MAPRCVSRRRLTLAREPIGHPIFLGAGIGADPGRRQRGALPHLVTDRAKPGVIAVNQRAVRFVNESSSYHHFASAMQDAAENAPVFTLRRPAMKRYGLGLARPAPVNNDARRRWLSAQSRYLAALAQQLGLDAQTLSKTVARYNRDAAQGVDRNLLKAATAITGRWAIRAISLTPVMPLLSAPFYAIKLYTGDLGTSRGWSPPPMPGSSIPKDTPSRAVRGGKRHGFADGRHLSGPRHHPRPGLTFGYLAACHLAQHSTH